MGIRIRGSRHSAVALALGGERIAATVRDHEVLTDQPERAGGSDSAPTPLELLSVSLASCIALYVRRYCAQQGLEGADLAVEVKPFWREDPGRIGRFDVTVHLDDGVPEHHRAAMLEVARKCPVHHTLAHAPELTISLKEHQGAGVAG